MKNSTMLMYLLGIVGTFMGMIIHINLMIETSKPIHLVCFLLWIVMCCCLTLIFRHKLAHNED